MAILELFEHLQSFSIFHIVKEIFIIVRIDMERRSRGRPKAWDDKTEQNTIKSLDRAMEVLDHLSTLPGATLSELAGDLDQSAATVYRILVTLEGRGIGENLDRDRVIAGFKHYVPAVPLERSFQLELARLHHVFRCHQRGRQRRNADRREWGERLCAHTQIDVVLGLLPGDAVLSVARCLPVFLFFSCFSDKRDGLIIHHSKL